MNVFLAAEGQADAPCIVDIQKPSGAQYANWRVATAMPEARGTKRYGFGAYEAPNYDVLIDHPVTLGEFALGSFDAHGAKHDIVISGCVTGLDMHRLEADLKRVCESQIVLFEPRTKKAPVDRYVVHDGRCRRWLRWPGASCIDGTDLQSRRSACYPGRPDVTDGYRTYLGLCSHEYFHTWNVKRIKPAAFAPYDLSQENYTSLLWLFEGFTSYYDDLMLVRSGLSSASEYFSLLGKTLGGVLRGSGRLKQTVAESSFDAWVKYYRQDENAANAIVSYYQNQKGSLVVLAFDLSIRAQTEGKKSLDDVIRLL